jgi:hypothetical protein
METTEEPPRRTLLPPRAHEWQEYMDGEVRCAACGRRKVRLFQRGDCTGAAKVTVDVE